MPTKTNRNRALLAVVSAVLGATLVAGASACGPQAGPAAETNDTTPPEKSPAGPAKTPGEGTDPGKGSGASKSRTVTLKPGELSQKPMPIPYWTAQGGGVILPGSRAVEESDVDWFATLAGSRFATVEADDQGAAAMSLADASGVKSLGPGGQAGPVASADGERFAWTTGDNQELVVTDSATGKVLQRRKLGFEATHLVGFAGDGTDVVVNTDDDARLYDPETGRSRTLDLKWVGAVLPGQDMMGGRTADDCQQVRHGDKVLWKGCDLAPMAFSPDGRYFVAQSVDADGAGNIWLKVVDLETDKVILKVQAELLNQVTWTPKGELALSVADAGKLALVTCRVGGECARGTEPLKWAGPGDDEPPYVLPMS